MIVKNSDFRKMLCQKSNFAKKFLSISLTLRRTIQRVRGAAVLRRMSQYQKNRSLRKRTNVMVRPRTRTDVRKRRTRAAKNAREAKRRVTTKRSDPKARMVARRAELLGGMVNPHSQTAPFICSQRGGDFLMLECDTHFSSRDFELWLREPLVGGVV